MIIRSAAQRWRTVPLPQPSLLSAVAGDLSSVAPGNNLVQQVPPEGFSRPPDKSPWLTLPAPGINPWENARTSQTPKVTENIHIPFWQVLSKHSVPERSGLPESLRAAAVQPQGHRLGCHSLARSFLAGEPSANIPRKRRKKLLPTWTKEVIQNFPPENVRNQQAWRRRWCQAGCCIRRESSRLRVAGLRGEQRPEQQSLLLPSPSIPSQAGTAFCVPPPSKPGKTPFAVAPDVHGESLWVYRHLGTGSSLPGQMMGWGEVVIFGAEGFFFFSLNKLEEVSLFFSVMRGLFSWLALLPHIFIPSNNVPLSSPPAPSSSSHPSNVSWVEQIKQEHFRKKQLAS